MGRRVLRRLIWGYAVCLCPTKGTPGLNEFIFYNEICEKAANFLFVDMTLNIGREAVYYQSEKRGSIRYLRVNVFQHDSEDK